MLEATMSLPLIALLLALAASAAPIAPTYDDDDEEPFLDDGGLVDPGPPGTPLPPHWRADLSVPAIRERAETGPGRPPWSTCVAARLVEGLPWDGACALVGLGVSQPDRSGRRAVVFDGPECTGPQRSLPGARPDTQEIPAALAGTLILRCVQDPLDGVARGP
jgi:hypothetical protein